MKYTFYQFETLPTLFIYLFTYINMYVNKLFTCIRIYTKYAAFYILNYIPFAKCMLHKIMIVYFLPKFIVTLSPHQQYRMASYFDVHSTFNHISD